MGFGYLLIGYLITFVLYLTVNALGFGFLALIIGYTVMLLGLRELKRYCGDFAYAEWVLFPLYIDAVYRGVLTFAKLFYWDIPFLTETVGTVFDWARFFLFILFNLLTLSAIRFLSIQVGLRHIATASVRNAFFVVLYAVLYMIGNLLPESDARNYLTFAVTLVNIVWITCNILLLLSCDKNICRAGDEEMPPKRSRFEWVNRMGDTYEKNQRKAQDTLRREAEERLMRKKERRSRKANRRK